VTTPRPSRAGHHRGDIANYLANTPGFFERHAELLAAVQLTSPHGQRAVSLQERQMEMLRERIKGLEGKIVEMIRHGQENVAIADRLHRWTRALLLTADAAAARGAGGRAAAPVPDPAGGLRLWGVDPAARGPAFAQAVSDDAKSFAASLALPYCGVNAGFEAAGWLDEPGHRDVDGDDPAAPRAAAAPSACWCWARPTPRATAPTWAPSS
jgi:uncharacterized protein